MNLDLNLDLIVKFIPYVFPGICCCIFLTAFIIADRSFQKSILIYFIIAVSSAFLLVTCDAIDFYLQIEKEYYSIRQIVGSLNYVFRISCVGSLVRISQRKNKTIICFIDIIVAINNIFSVLNIWFGWIFQVNPDHTYNFGFCLFIPYGIIFIFVVLFIHSTIKYFRTNMGESVVIIGICIICLTANIIEMNLDVKIVLGQAFSISSVLYYLCLITELYKRDALTDVFNRRTFFLDAKGWKNKSFGIIMLDLNDLKKFNDEEGHIAGDTALLTSVSCLQKVFKKYGSIYRLGGDEFSILIKNRNISKIENLLNMFDGTMKKTKYRMAYGYSIYNPLCDFQQVMEDADTKMYIKKESMKGVKPR